MSLSDPIGDMLARLKNSQMRNHKKVEWPSSKFKAKIAEILKSEGYIIDYEVKSDDNKANLHIIFPEVNFDKVDKIRGLDITIVVKSNSKEHSLELLKKFNFPFMIERSNWWPNLVQ